jgi:hypothetical protein
VRLQIIDVEEIGDFSMAPMCTPHPPQQFTDALDWLAGNGRILVKSQAFPRGYNPEHFPIRLRHSLRPSCAGLTRASIHFRKKMDCRVKPGNDRG